MKKQKKFTLTFWMGVAKRNDIFEVVDCDNWIEIDETSIPKIFCINEKKDSVIAYPAVHLRKVIQNFGVRKEMDIDDVHICDESGRSYT